MKLRSLATVGWSFVSGTMLALTAGVMMQLWFADNIELHGLGDGLSFIICISIMSSAWGAQGLQRRTGLEEKDKASNNHSYSSFGKTSYSDVVTDCSLSYIIMV